nr:putative integron gene cassette protein [uncultured bacterium]CEN54973.1 putative integron gene cassette protein [uncultured bacterium]
MFQTFLSCPSCKSRITLESARTVVPQPELNTFNKSYQLVYTVCPRCGRDFRIIGEKKAAVLVLSGVGIALLSGYFIDSWWPLGVVALLLTFQRKIAQACIRAEHA